MGNAQTKGPQQKGRGQKKYVHWDQAVPPWPPGKPHLVPGPPDSQSDVVTIRWDPPPEDGGAPITGYVVEHRKAGAPHWVRATADAVLLPELKLGGLEPGWRYQFRVTAQNAADLLSDPGELSQPLTVARAYRPATMAPQFSLELQDTVALENEKAQFAVHFHGIPTPKVVWYKDSFEIFSSRRMRVAVENDTSSLVIHQTAFTDEGEYKCTATNRAGHIISKAKLRLEAPPRIRIPRQYEDGLIFEKDEVIRLKVSVAGRPLPRTTWYHDGEPIPFGGRYEVSNTDRSSGLRISDAQRGDRGEYQVRATSRLGEDAVAFLVTVTDRPMPPGRPDVTAAAGRSVTLSWTQPEDDGGCKIGNYIVEYYRLGWNVWLKAATCRHLTTSMSDLIEGSEYKFRVKAENPYGVSEPSCESAVVFIADPKRRLLEQPVRASAGRIDIAPSDQLADSKRDHKHSEDSSVARRKFIQENKECERKTEFAGKEPEDRTELKSELMQRIERNFFKQQEMSDVTRRNKENHERTAGSHSAIASRQRRKDVDEADLQSAAESPLRTSSVLPEQEAEKSVKASLQFAVTRRRDSLAERDSGVSEGSCSDGRQNVAAALLPREDDSLLHGSSELMLVLLPQTRNTHSDTDIDCSSDFAVFGDGGVPPPLSLSSPELGCGEPWVISPLRNAVSSTELLHEQAMARFYRAVAAEEAEREGQRIAVDRSAIPTEAGEFSRTVHSRTLELAPKQELRWPKGRQVTLEESRASSDAATRVLRASQQREVNLKSTLRRKEAEILLGEEDEEEEEEEEEEELERTVMKAVTDVDDRKRHYILGHGGNEQRAREEEKEVNKDEEMKLQEEDEEEQAEEELFEEFYENEELEEEESLGEVSSEFEEEEDLYKSMEDEDDDTYHPSSKVTRQIERLAAQEDDDTYHPSSKVTRQIERLAAQEDDDTYHPISKVHLSRVSQRQTLTHPDTSTALHSILKHNLRFQDDVEDTIHRKHELPLHELERSPPKSFRESLPKELEPSFIPDRRSRSISPFEPQPLEQSHPPAREDIRRKGYVRTEDEKVSMPTETAPSVERPIPWTAGSRISTPKPNGHIAAAVISTTESFISTVTPVVLAAEAAKQKRMLTRKASVEEDTEASRAVADYYGDIIRDHARPKKPVRQYLNTAEMKAAAYVSKEEDANMSKSYREAPREPELSVETQTVTAGQSARDGYTAPAQRPRTSRTKSRTPEATGIRQSSKDRSRVSSTERFSAKLSQQLPELARGFSPERTQPEKPPQELRPATTNLDEHLQVTNKKWRSLFSYLADVAMFLVACWLYAFKDERLAIPVLALMVYRQLREAVKRKLPKLPQLPWKRSS